VWRRPQDLYYTKEIDKITGNLFLQHTHTMWNAQTRAFCEACKPTVLVMHRNIYDNVVSTVDHLLKIDTGLPNGWVGDDFKNLTFEQAAWHVIYYFMPWNINFYCSWAHAHLNGIKVVYVDYADLVSNTIAELGRILAAIGQSRTLTEIEAAITFASNPADTRFNVGKPGRGMTLLSSIQREVIDEMLKHFADKEGQTVISRISTTPHENNTIRPHDGRRHRIDPQDAAIGGKRKNTSGKDRSTRRLPSHAPRIRNAA
jgi:hypothetical protein